MSEPISNFTERFNLILERNHVSSSELLKRLKAYGDKISLSTISQYKSGYSCPKSDRLYNISKALNVEPAWLIGFDVPMINIEFSDENASTTAKISQNNRLLSYFNKMMELQPEYQQKIMEEIDFLYNLENK